MSVEVQITAGPLTLPRPWRPAEAGAVMAFEGIVRPTEEGERLLALDYEAYEPMTSRVLTRLGGEVLDRHGLIALRVEHSVGRVPAGECSFRLLIASRHRKEGLAGMDEFIDRMKREVPLWKVPVFATSGEVVQ